MTIQNRAFGAIKLASIVFGASVSTQVLADDGKVAAAPAFELDANVDLVSDYRFRGVSLSNRDPAVQPSITLTHRSGFYVSAWGSNIADNGGDDIEVDLSGGYGFTLGEAKLSGGAVYYLYPDASASNYVELLGSVEGDVGSATFAFNAGYVPAQANTGNRDNTYLALSASSPVAGPVSLSAGLGWENGAFADHKLDWQAGLEAEFGSGFSGSLSYVDTRRSFAGRNGGAGVVLKLSKAL